VKLLLENGAEVFGAGWNDTTVLMKPFLVVDKDVVATEYAEFELPDDSQDEDLVDLTTSDCLRTLLDHILSRNLAIM
jgi:hypothetical protein